MRDRHCWRTEAREDVQPPAFPVRLNYDRFGVVFTIPTTTTAVAAVTLQLLLLLRLRLRLLLLLPAKRIIKRRRRLLRRSEREPHNLMVILL